MDTQVITWATGTSSSSGDVPLVAAPGAGLAIVVCHLQTQNESATADQYIVKEGSTARARYLAQNQGDGIIISVPKGFKWKLPANTALNWNKSQAVAGGYTVGYYLEPA